MDCAFISGNINDKDLICTNIFNEKLVILSQKGNFKQNINENKSIIMFGEGCFIEKFLKIGLIIMILI